MISNALTNHNHICNCTFRNCLSKLTNIFIDFVQVVYEKNRMLLRCNFYVIFKYHKFQKSCEWHTQGSL